MAGCGDVLSLEDLQTAKKHQIFEAEVITGKAGGVAGGATIDTATNPVTGQTQQTLPSILADLGFDVQSWTSSTGGVLASANQVFLNDTSGSLGLGDYYAWGGTFPKTVPAGTDPALVGSGYIMRSSRLAGTQAREALRRSYAEAGYNLVDGSFEAGGTLTNINDVLLHEASGKAYGWGGSLPKVVSPGTPVTLFIDKSPFSAGAGVVRGSRFALRDFVSVKDFGAVGDGITDDYVSIQAAVDSGAKRIHFPSGTYYSSQSIKLEHTTSAHRRDTGQVFYGDGIHTILTRNNTTDTQGPTEIEWDQRSFFSVYGSYNEFKDMQFYGCPVAVYFGQDPAKIGIELSDCSFNKMQNLLVQDCGTGFLSACARGHYYNHYEAIHIVQCQIAVYFTVHSSWPTPTTSNNNRNTFINIRAARCQVGFWLSNGDTNSSYSFHCEGCSESPTNNGYPVPTGLPGGLTTATFIIEADNNAFYSCFHEACGFYIYHDALYTQSFGNLFRIDEEPAKQNFVTPFYHHFDTYTAWLAGGSFASISNTNPAAFPNTPAGYSVTQAPKGGYTVGDRTLVQTTATAEQTFEKEYVKQLGAIAAGGTSSLTLWSEVTSHVSNSSVFEVTVVGNAQVAKSVHANSFKVVALRNVSRTLTLYYVYDQSVGRGTGVNTGDNSEPIVPALSVGGVNNKDLILTFTVPNKLFASVSVTIKQLYSQ